MALPRPIQYRAIGMCSSVLYDGRLWLPTAAGIMNSLIIASMKTSLTTNFSRSSFKNDNLSLIYLSYRYSSLLKSWFMKTKTFITSILNSTAQQTDKQPNDVISTTLSTFHINREKSRYSEVYFYTSEPIPRSLARCMHGSTMRSSVVVSWSIKAVPWTAVVYLPWLRRWDRGCGSAEVVALELGRGDICWVSAEL